MTLGLTFFQMMSILMVVSGEEFLSNSTRLVNIFNTSDELKLFGIAKKVEEVQIRPDWEPELIIYQILFHNAALKTLFLLKFGQYLK